MANQPATTSRKRTLTIVLTVFAAVATYLVLPPDVNELGRRTAAIFVVAAVFWATEAIPLFATSLLIVGLLIVAVAGDGGLATKLPALSAWPEADGQRVAIHYKSILASFASPVIMLFLGGFLLSRAVIKHGLDKVFAARMLRPFTGSPALLVFGVLGISAFFSMWISNTATAAMMIVIIAPLVKSLPAKDRFHRALVLAVPFGANIGGIGTPIGTPPNAIAIGLLRSAGYQISFTDWMLLAVPLAVLLLVLAGIALLSIFPPEKGLQIEPVERSGRLDGRGRATLVLLVITIGLWLTSKWTGLSDAAVALLAATGLTTLGLLDRFDLRAIDWDVLILMWGGLALGDAMMSSGLVEYGMQLPLIDTLRGLPGPMGAFIFAAFIVVVAMLLSTFMSNTATAALLIPMALQLVPGSEGAQLAILGALACSCAMAMPVSTPPNAIAFATGQVPAVSLIRAGGLVSVIAVILLLIGYKMVIPLWINLESVAMP